MYRYVTDPPRLSSTNGNTVTFYVVIYYSVSVRVEEASRLRNEEG